MNSIADIIKKNRKSKKLTQQELCDELLKHGVEVSVKAVSAWEHGACIPQLVTFFAICEVLGIKENLSEEIFGIRPQEKLANLNSEGRRMAEDYIDYLLSIEKYSA